MLALLIEWVLAQPVLAVAVALVTLSYLYRREPAPEPAREDDRSKELPDQENTPNPATSHPPAVSTLDSATGTAATGSEILRDVHEPNPGSGIEDHDHLPTVTPACSPPAPQPSAVAKSTMIYEIKLKDGVPRTRSGEVIVLPIPKEPYTLRLLSPATDMVTQQGVVHTNYPPADKEFDRNSLYQYHFGTDNLHHPCFVDIEVHRSGTFTCFVEYSSPTGSYETPSTKTVRTEPWHFLVDSSFELGGELLTSNSLCVQTVLPKLMGPVHEWDDKLAAIADKGYNVIHFVPLQKRGESNSPFSILDQLSWDEEVLPNGESDVKALTEKMEQQYKILSISDIVLNHTANNSTWLKDHPDAGYSATTAPHLKGAIELENAVLEYSKKLAAEGFEIHSGDDTQRAIDGFEDHVFQKSRLWEFYVVDVDTIEKTVSQNPFQGRPPKDLPESLNEIASAVVHHGGVNWHKFGGRFHRQVDTSVLAEYVAGSKYSARQILDEINATLYVEYGDDRKKIIHNIANRINYTRLDAHGPKLGPKLTPELALIEPYFTRVSTKDGSVVELVNNGWVWGGNPLIDNAGPDSKVYLTRDVIIWGDCVKIRYGKKPEDSPYAWERMGKYCRLLAKYFHGLRVDNAHSTPIEVGQYMMDQARIVRPNLFVVAELFTGSPDMDKLYVERMGINSLLREAIQPGSPKDLSTMINVNGGIPIGSFIHSDVYKDNEISVVRPRLTHSWLMEMTHDNESFAQKRTVEDTLSTAALVATCLVSSGTAVGSDECYPTALNIVSEHRPYVFGGGISRAKKVLNEMHVELGKINAHESYTDHQGQYITVHRLNPETGEGYFVIARTKFWSDSDEKLADAFLEKTKATWHAGWKLVSKSHENKETSEKIVPLDVELVDLEPFNVDFDGSSSKIWSPSGADFPQGSVAIFKTERTFDASKLEHLLWTGHREAVAELDLLHLNVLLYRTEAEERTNTEGKFGTYAIPNHGHLNYAGIQGWESVMIKIVVDNNLGHPVCANLREGMWAFDSIVERLRYYARDRHIKQLEPTISWLEERIELSRQVPSYLRPRYFAGLVLGLYQAASFRAAHLMPKRLGHTEIGRRLSLASIQMVTELPGASLYPDRDVPSMAAGLPHFSEGIMRCWGRDVFLSLSGLLLETHRFEEARQHILGFAATLKHGLIPNLLDSGRNPRYNARDAVWFFAQSIQEYCIRTKSHDILNEKVKRRFPKDDRYVAVDDPEAFSYESSIGEIIYEILSRHAAGIEFREHNAGPQIDSHMKDNGFNQKIWVDWNNGLVFGGNQDNCGTWMDKMGESKNANNDGVPGTPRDGAAIEITGLLKSCLRWVGEVRQHGGYNFPETVKNQNGDEISLSHWNDLIQKSFEHAYYVPKNQAEDANYDVESEIVNRRGIYKDLYRSGKPYEDYQLRPNFAVAIVAAPELFDTSKVVGALDLADRVLRKPYGMATLDPSDYNYRPNYENSIDDTDFYTSKGRNYHQGPEWLWCAGMFYQALVVVNKKRDVPIQQSFSDVRERVQGMIHWLLESPWAGLTELTNENGAFCQDSSPTQAWSAARLLDVFAELTGERQ